MTDKKSQLKTWSLILGGASLIFALWLSILYAIWIYLRSSGYYTSSWTMVAALSTAFAIPAAITAGIVAFHELEEVKKSRYMEVADRLFKELNSQENIAARRWVFLNLTNDPKEGMKTITEEGRTAVKRVLNSLDQVSFLTQPGWIPDDIVMPWMHPMIYKSWEKLEPYVKYEREQRKEHYYYAYAEKLADRCKQWRAKNKIEETTTWVDHAL